VDRNIIFESADEDEMGMINKLTCVRETKEFYAYILKRKCTSTATSSGKMSKRWNIYSQAY